MRLAQALAVNRLPAAFFRALRNNLHRSLMLAEVLLAQSVSENAFAAAIKSTPSLSSERLLIVLMTETLRSWRFEAAIRGAC